MNSLADDILMIVKVFAAAVAGFFILAGCFGISHWNSVLFAILILINIFLSTLIVITIMILVIMLGELIWLKFKQFFD